MGDAPLVLLDVGVSCTKCGYIGEGAPRHIVPTPQVSRGHDVLNSSLATITAGQPPPTSAEWQEVLRPFLSHLFSVCLHSPPQDASVVLLHDASSPGTFTNALCEVLFGALHVSTLWLLPSPATAILTTGYTTGLVVDCGHCDTTMIPVCDGIPLMDAMRLGGNAGASAEHTFRSLIATDGSLSLRGQQQPASVVLDTGASAALPSIALRDMMCRCCLLQPLAPGVGQRNGDDDDDDDGDDDDGADGDGDDEGGGGSQGTKPDFATSYGVLHRPGPAVAAAVLEPLTARAGGGRNSVGGSSGSGGSSGFGGAGDGWPMNTITTAEVEAASKVCEEALASPSSIARPKKLTAALAGAAVYLSGRAVSEVYDKEAGSTAVALSESAAVAAQGVDGLEDALRSLASLSAELVSELGESGQARSSRPLSVGATHSTFLLASIKPVCFEVNAGGGSPAATAAAFAYPDLAPLVPAGRLAPQHAGFQVQVPPHARVGALECLFRPSTADEAPPLHFMLCDAILACPLDLRPLMVRNVCLCGGTACVPGFRRRLEEELINLVAPELFKGANALAECQRYPDHITARYRCLKPLFVGDGGSAGRCLGGGGTLRSSTAWLSFHKRSSHAFPCNVRQWVGASMFCKLYGSEAGMTSSSTLPSHARGAAGQAAESVQFAQGKYGRLVKCGNVKGVVRLTLSDFEHWEQNPNVSNFCPNWLLADC